MAPRLYSTKVSTRRWPLQMFYNVLDLAGINAYILYKEVSGKKKISRREFLLKLCLELQMKSTMNEDGKLACSDEPIFASPSTKTTRQWCKINCTRKKRKLTSKTCARCNRFVCTSCTASTRTEVICKKC